MCGNNEIYEVEPGVYEVISDYVPSSRRALFYRAEAVIKASGRDVRYCERCGEYDETGKKHHRHHIDRDIHNARSDNIEILCVKCHMAEHPERLNFKYMGAD